MQVIGPMGMEDIGMNIKDNAQDRCQNQSVKKMKVADAKEVLIDSEASKLVDQDEVIRIAKEKAENDGIVFIDEIDSSRQQCCIWFECQLMRSFRGLIANLVKVNILVWSDFYRSYSIYCSWGFPCKCSLRYDTRTARAFPNSSRKWRS